YTCSGNKIINSCTGGVTSICSASTICSAGACIQPTPSGTFIVQPALVHGGASTTLTWSTTNVVANSCSVSGTNGDIWTHQPAVNATGYQSSPITAATSYTLTCTGIDGSTLQLTRSVSLIPSFQEK